MPSAPFGQRHHRVRVHRRLGASVRYRHRARRLARWAHSRKPLETGASFLLGFQHIAICHGRGNCRGTWRRVSRFQDPIVGCGPPNDPVNIAISCFPSAPKAAVIASSGPLSLTPVSLENRSLAPAGTALASERVVCSGVGSCGLVSGTWPTETRVLGSVASRFAGGSDDRRRIRRSTNVVNSAATPPQRGQRRRMLRGGGGGAGDGGGGGAGGAPSCRCRACWTVVLSDFRTSSMAVL